MNLTMLDTGYIDNASRTGKTQLSDANRAGYTGSAVTSFTLKVTSITAASKAAIENKPIINTMVDSPTSMVSISNAVYKVSGIIAKTITTAGYSTNDRYQFWRLDKTKGLKLLYPSAVTDTDKTIVEALGAINTGSHFSDGSPTADSGTVSSTTPYLVGFVRNLTITDDAVNKKNWRVDFDFEVSG